MNVSEAARLQSHSVLRESVIDGSTTDAAQTRRDRTAHRARDSRQRIVFVNRYYYPDESATSRILYDLATSLAQRGFDVHVVTSRQLYCNPAAQLPRSEVIRGVRVHRIWTCRFGRTQLLGRLCDYVSFYPSAFWTLLQTVRRGDLLVAKTDPPMISVIAAAVAKVRRTRLINWLQDVFPEVATELAASPLPSWMNRAIQRLRDHSLFSAEYNVVLGKRMQEVLLNRGVAARSLKVIANWADGSDIRPHDHAVNRLRETYCLKEKFVVAYSGNLGRAHEYGTILSAAEHLQQRSDIVFLMIGDGVNMQRLKHEANERHLKNFVFLPYQPRELLSDSLSAADVHLACLLPSLEGLVVPSKVYGALAAGRPVIFIGDHNGEIAQLVRSGDCGAVVGVGEHEALVSAILKFNAEPDMKKAMGIRAREIFDEHYTLHAATASWLEVLRPPDSRS